MQYSRLIFKRDNHVARYMMYKTIGTNRRKFIDLRRHFLCFLVTEGKFLITIVPAAAHKADIFTKTLYKVLLQIQGQQLGLTDHQ